MKGLAGPASVRAIPMATNCLPTWSVIARLTAIAFAAREPAERTPCSWRTARLSWVRPWRPAFVLTRASAAVSC
jgi:hypothetical protein